MSREFRMAIEQSKGPLPPADSFAGYERVLPGAAERIMRMAERQQVHRQRCEAAALTMDRQALNAGIRLEAAGLSCGFVIAIVFFLASCWLVYIGREIAGTLLGTVDIVALVGTFVYGRHMRLKAAAERVSED